MTSLAELVDVVIGVDTHKHTHTASVVVAGTGAEIEHDTAPTDPGGYDALVAMAERHGDHQHEREDAQPPRPDGAGR